MFYFNLRLIIVAAFVGPLSVGSFLPLHPERRGDFQNYVCQYRIDSVSTNTFSTESVQLVKNCCVLESAEFPDIAIEIAHRLSLSLFTMDNLNSPTTDQRPIVDTLTHALVIEPYSFAGIRNYSVGIIPLNEVSLLSSPHPKRRPRISPSVKPFFVDFLPSTHTPLGRRSSGDTGPDFLLKATNIRRLSKNDSSTPFMIYDLTAGWGHDSLLMALAVMQNDGKVHMVERHPLVASLLEDALRRIRLISAQLSPGNAYHDISTYLSHCLSLECSEGTEIHNSDIARNLPPDVIYLDPMFPIRKKSASVKKNMQILHGLLGTQTIRQMDEDQKDEEESILLCRAYQLVKNRVVIKRPLHAPPLIGAKGLQSEPDHRTDHLSLLKPSYQIFGSTSRWDIYAKTVPRTEYSA